MTSGQREVAGILQTCVISLIFDEWFDHLIPEVARLYLDPGNWKLFI